MSKSPVKITCHHCGYTQTVEGGTLSTFCTRCHSRIENEAALAKTKKGSGLFHRPAQSEPIKQKKVSCPNCKTKNTVPYDAVSAFCKNCKNIISLKKGKSFATPVPTETKTEVALKKVRCFYCNTEQKVSTIAYSAVCACCGKRIQLQDMEIKGRHMGDITTGGRLFIRQGGFVQAAIKAADIEIEGEVRGTIHAENRLTLKPSSKVFGDVEAKDLVIQEGAVFKGAVRANSSARHIKL